MSSSVSFLLGQKTSIYPENRQNIGRGAEKAVVFLAEALAHKGYQVIVFADVKPMIINGVYYLHVSVFNKYSHCNIIIWRLEGMLQYLSNRDQTRNIFEKIFFDMHDFLSSEIEFYHLPIDYVMTKSDFHREHFVKLSKVGPKQQIIAIKNGIELGKPSDNLVRNLKRICFCSAPQRGLREMLQVTWPIIISMVPNAEFHIYHSNYVLDPNKYNVNQKGIYMHSTVSQQEIIDEMAQSTFYLYIARNELMEADCLAIREADYYGCIPVISDQGVFQERPGIKIKKTKDLLQQYIMAAAVIVKHISNPELLTKIVHDRPFTWSDCAEEWSQLMTLKKM